jgi:hypothetical protein
MLKVVNSIHTRGKPVQIVLTFLIIGIAVIWCHYFTKLTGAKGKSTTGLLLNTLVCFISFYLLFYSSYILRRRLQTTQQMNWSTTSSIAPEEVEQRWSLVVSVDVWMRMCWNCDFKQCVVVYGWIWMLMSMFLMNVYGIAYWCEWMCWIWMWINCVLCEFIVHVL